MNEGSLGQVECIPLTSFHRATSCCSRRNKRLKCLNSLNEINWGIQIAWWPVREWSIHLFDFEVNSVEDSTNHSPFSDWTNDLIDDGQMMETSTIRGGLGNASWEVERLEILLQQTVLYRSSKVIKLFSAGHIEKGRRLPSRRIPAANSISTSLRLLSQVLVHQDIYCRTME